MLFLNSTPYDTKLEEMKKKTAFRRNILFQAGSTPAFSTLRYYRWMSRQKRSSSSTLNYIILVKIILFSKIFHVICCKSNP